MKILKAIPSEKLPRKSENGGARRNPKYDSLVEKILSLPEGKALPVECESRLELNNLRTILKKRSEDIALTSRDLILYASRK